MEALVDFTVSEQPAAMISKTGGLQRPNNIYAVSENPIQRKAEPVVREIFAEPVAAQQSTPSPAPTPAPIPAPVMTTPMPVMKEPAIEEEMHLVVREEAPVAPAPVAIQETQPQDIYHQEEFYLDENEEQKRRAAERIQKLRNLSFNMNSSDPNNEFDSVPAYIRRNMELFGNTLTSAEHFYSKVTVGVDSNNQPNLSTRNSFLDGKRPD